jgi:hypothetical protein
MTRTKTASRIIARIREKTPARVKGRSGKVTDLRL